MQRPALLVAVFVIIIAISVYVSKAMFTELFANPPTDLLAEQRQQLQMEGERRFNDLARLQDPSNKLDKSAGEAAFGGAAPVPKVVVAALQDLQGTSGNLTPQDNTAGKALDVNTTGQVYDKIAYCESIKNIDCNGLANMPECGFCHQRGTDSKGRAHRGGMYISADDQIRANEKAKATGKPAQYIPTIGTCAPGDFTLMKDRCEARENQLECQRAGAPMASNKCGQCFGTTPANSTGLIYVGPKPQTFDARLIVSHPCGGISIDGVAEKLSPRVPAVGIDFQELPLTLKEGQSIRIQIKSIKPLWTAWLQSKDRSRSIPLDIGVTNKESLPLRIAGTTSSTKVRDLLRREGITDFQGFQSQVPNTVLWYETKDNKSPDVTLEVTIPATLTKPFYDEDAPYCSAGPIITTEVGAGLMGANSCFTASGAFNPSVFCLQNLFMSAGGSIQGKAWPATADKVTPLLRPSATAPTLDETVAYLNTLGSIASYGADLAGRAVDFETYKAACQMMLGFVPLNPCEGPNKLSGPHSAACLDYLWKTSGNAAADTKAVDPAGLPYEYCSAAGALAPLNPDGSINQSNTALANSRGSMGDVRQFFADIFGASQNSSDFDKQAAALRNCFGVELKKPVQRPEECPPPNADELQCLPPSSTFIVPKAGDTISLRSTLVYDYHIRAYGSNWQISRWFDWPANGWHSYASDATLVLREGLNGKPDYVSITLAAQPGTFLRHMGFVAYAQPYEENPLFKEDASFRIINGLNGAGNTISFQSANYPDRFLMQDPGVGRIILDTATDANALQRASWIPTMALSGAGSYRGTVGSVAFRELAARAGDNAETVQCLGENDAGSIGHCTLFTTLADCEQTIKIKSGPLIQPLQPMAKRMDEFIRSRV